jgi:hypothetical protein
VPRYLTPEWVQAFDDALGALDLTEAIAAAGAGSLSAADGAFSVAQVITGAPDDLRVDGIDSSEVRTVLRVADGRARLALDPDSALPANVTMVLSYADAKAMALGSLEPADALAAGRIRVRGDLAALVASQSVLAAVATQLGAALSDLTDD